MTFDKVWKSLIQHFEAALRAATLTRARGATSILPAWAGQVTENKRFLQVLPVRWRTSLGRVR
jgi:hypothetical protein